MKNIGGIQNSTFTDENMWVEVDEIRPSRLLLYFKVAVVVVNIVLYIAVMSFAYIPGVKEECLNFIEDACVSVDPFGENPSISGVRDSFFG